MPKQKTVDIQDNHNTSPSSSLKWLWISFVVIFIDQITKWTAVSSLELISEGGTSYPVIPYLNFTLAYNYGAAFGFLQDQSGWQRWFFIGLTLVVCIVILFWMKNLKESERWTAVGLSFVLGGAVGNNLIDRMFNGRVTDFIDVYSNWDVFFLSKWADNYFHFATFNVADIAINIGAIILVVGSFFYSED